MTLVTELINVAEILLVLEHKFVDNFLQNYNC